MSSAWGIVMSCYLLTHSAAGELSTLDAASAQLTESEARFRAAFENAAVGIAHVAPDGSWLRVNRRLCEIIGYAKDELLAKTFQDITHPDDLEADQAQLRRMCDSGVDTYKREKRYLCKDGSAVWVRLTVGAVRKEDGTVDYFISVFEDISEQKRAEMALRASEERFRGIFEHAATGIAIADLQGLFQSCNPAYAHILGYSEDELRALDFPRLLHPEDREANMVEVSRLIAQQIPSFEIVNRYVAKDGRSIWVHKHGSLLRDAAGQPTGMIALVTDMTEAKRQEAQAHRAEEIRLEGERRNRYLLELEKRLQNAGTAGAAVSAACEALGEELGATFALVGEWQPESGDIVVESAWSARGDLAPLLGRRRIVTLGGEYTAALLAGEAVTVTDVAVEAPATGGGQAAQASLAALGVRSLIGVPLMRDSKPRAFLFVAGVAPRHWTGAEAELARDTVERAWQAVEKAHAAALRESEQGLRHLGDSLPDGAVYQFVRGPDGNSRCNYVSVGIEQLIGISPEDLLRDASVIDRQVLPEYRPRLIEAEQRSARDLSDFKVEVPVRRPDGEVRWIRFQSRPQRMPDKSVMWEGIATDITDRKRAEEALRTSEERFRGIFEHAGTGIAILDLEGRFQSCNPAYSSMLGYSEEELQALLFQDLVHPEDLDANMAENRRLLVQEIPAFEIVNRYVRRDGKPIWVHKHISLLRDAAGTPTNLIALVTDMTDRQRHEEQIRLLMHEVNHRSKNMLALVQAVARQTRASNPDDFIERFGERIQALAAAQDLLVKNDWRGVDLEELVLSQLAHFKDLIGTRIGLRGPALLISASAAQTIGMALHELATNAGKYGALSTRVGRVEIEWSLERPEGDQETFALTWRETGGPALKAPSRQGFGSTVICTLAEASLDAKVKLDFAACGLSWRLQCPAANVGDIPSEPVLEIANPTSSNAPASTRPRVLVVEDEALLALEIAHVLSEAGFNVIGSARAVAQALSLIEETGCDVAVLDVNLGGETSEPVAWRLLARGTPFVALSGYSRAQHPPVFSSAPAFAKPLQPEPLIAEIRRCLGEAATRHC